VPDRPEECGGVFERSGLLELADEDRVVAGVADQLLGQLARAVLGGVRDPSGAVTQSR
jgi:hypothetical protein